MACRKNLSGLALGSVRQLTDAAGAVTLAKTYDPYGRLRSLAQSAGSPSTSLGFTGEVTDPAASTAQDALVYLRARYYDPGAGRFTTRDTWPGVPDQPQSLNRYAYGLDNPVLYTDPSGHCPWCVLAGAALLGGAALGGADLWQQLAKNGGRWGCVDWSEFLTHFDVGAMIGAAALMAAVGIIPMPLFLAGAGMVLGDMYHGNSNGMLLDGLLLFIPGGEEMEMGGEALDAAMGAGEIDAAAKGLEYMPADEAYNAFRSAKSSGDFIDLFHATSSAGAENLRNIGIDSNYFKPFRDFGRGFYTTLDEEQAIGWAKQLFGEDGTVLHFQIPTSDFEQLNGYSFRGTSDNWYEFVTDNRVDWSTPARYSSYDYISGTMLLNPKEYLYGSGIMRAGGQQTVFYSQEAFDLLLKFLKP
jgi:RHS repeat-associated protein